jgi:hypothetical protein
MDFTTGKVLSQWSYTVEVEFTPLPPEKEDWKFVAQLSNENTVVLLKLTELKNIQINEK